jgi:hypothetical protein
MLFFAYQPCRHYVLSRRQRLGSLLWHLSRGSGRSSSSGGGGRCFSGSTLHKKSEHNDDNELSVGIFIDMDNVAPREYTRSAAIFFVEPIRYFCEQILNGIIVRFNAWGNESTNTFSGGRSQQQPEDDFLEALKYQPWDGTSAVSGYDETGTLRCGVCGQKMKLSKKDGQKNGFTLEDKLQKHMKELHGREQTKRLNRRKQKKGGKLSDKEFERMLKFKCAAVGVLRQGTANDLFQVMRERGLRCKVVKDADRALQVSAENWMNEVVKKTGGAAALVLVSCDSDFRPTLELAREKGLLVVSVSPNAKMQTRKLVEMSDIVLETRSDTFFDSDGIFAELNNDLFDFVYKISARTALGKEMLRKTSITKLEAGDTEEQDKGRREMPDSATVISR